MDLATFRSFELEVPPADAWQDSLGHAVPSDATLQTMLARFLIAQECREDIPLMHPDRRPMRMDWRRALRHFRVLESDKERTREAFHVFEALPWVGMADAACRFLANEQGKAIYASEPFLPAILDDHPTLRRLPKGSLAHAYCDHMEHEELSAAGLIAEYEEWRGDRERLDDKVEWYADRLRDTHDLLHVLSGFGRDALGEQCVLAMVFKQRPSIGHLFIGYAGAVLTRLESHWKVPVLRSVFEARQIGKACLPIAEQPINELLAMPLEAVRKRLNMRPARYYHEAHRIWREAGTDPRMVLMKAAG
ncbi:MAG: Coq4 family protein [Novosphingobium sp.]